MKVAQSDLSFTKIILEAFGERRARSQDWLRLVRSCCRVMERDDGGLGKGGGDMTMERSREM